MRKIVENVNHQVPVTAEQLFEALHGVMHRVRSQHQAELKTAAPALTPLEGRVLGFFARQPGATLSDLAAHAGRDKGQLARLVAGLREQGLLEAQADAADARLTRLHLTEAARVLHQTVQRSRRRLAERAATGLADDERRQLLSLLQRLQANLGDDD